MSKKHSKEIIEAFSNASRHYSDASILMHEAIARKVGLPGTDHKYLGLILQHRELTAGTIARLTGLATGAVTGLIDRLEKKKLVKRKFSKEDRRKVMIVPNEENAMRLLGLIFGALTQRTAGTRMCMCLCAWVARNAKSMTVANGGNAIEDRRSVDFVRLGSG